MTTYSCTKTQAFTNAWRPSGPNFRFTLGTFLPRCWHFACMCICIRTKHVWGFPLSQDIFCQEFAVPQLIYCVTKCNNILKWDLGYFIYSSYDFIIQTFDVSLQNLSGNWFQQNYLVHVRKYSPMFTYHFQVPKSKRRAAEDLCLQDDTAMAVTSDRPKRSRKLIPRGKAFVERVREVSHQHSDEPAGPSHSRQDMATQLSAGGHVNQQPAQPTQLSTGGPTLDRQQPAQLSAGGPLDHQPSAQLSAGSRLLEQPVHLPARGSSHPPLLSLHLRGPSKLGLRRCLWPLFS